MTTLSQRLFSSLPDGFFRPLAARSAAVYVDCADRLVEAAGETGRLPLAEAVAVVREVLMLHPRDALEADEGGDLSDVRARAGRFYNKLLEVRWLEAHSASLHERWAVISPALRPVLRMWKSLAVEELAELKGFADTLRQVCTTLEKEGIFAPQREPDDLRSEVKDLADRLGHAIEQLHSVEKLILAFERRQQASASGAETLRIFYHEFYEGEHMVCQDALRRGGLLSRLHRARSVVRDAMEHPVVRQRLADGIAAWRGVSMEDAWDRADTELSGIERSLAGIRARADAIDLRIAAFNRLSIQRLRYQTEMRGRRPELIKRYCDAMNALHAGEKFSQLHTAAAKPDFALLVPAAGFIHGTASLARPRKSRAAVPLDMITMRSAPEDDPAEMERLRERQRLALTPFRAARLIIRLLPEKGRSITTADFACGGTDELLDLMAAAAYAQAPDGHGHTVRWSVSTARRLGLTKPEEIPADAHAGWKVERLTLCRTA